MIDLINNYVEFEKSYNYLVKYKEIMTTILNIDYLAARLLFLFFKILKNDTLLLRGEAIAEANHYFIPVTIGIICFGKKLPVASFFHKNIMNYILDILPSGPNNYREIKSKYFFEFLFFKKP